MSWRERGIPPARAWALAEMVLAGAILGLYVVEPLIAAVSGRLPDASMFRSVIGDEWRLVFWLAMSCGPVFLPTAFWIRPGSC